MPNTSAPTNKPRDFPRPSLIIVRSDLHSNRVNSCKKKAGEKSKKKKCSEEIPGIVMPRLKAAATIEHTKNTFDGENRSEMVNTAKNNVPAIKNPNCTELVRLARKLSSRLNCLMISGDLALPANQGGAEKLRNHNRR